MVEDRRYYLLGLKAVGDFGVTIAVPAVLAGIVGTRLDARWGTKPFLLFGCFALAAALSGLIIYRKAKRYGSEYQSLLRQKSNLKGQ
jgi:MFS-type transporter involved in bile tolerance (Atg22 family)